MKQYKKRTLALILASAVTVVGAFGAENYKNSLMSLKFESGTSGNVNVTLLTKHNYEKDLNIIRKDVNTYVLMLPETNSEAKSSDYELGQGIQSVDVQTMPYTTSSSGYTKVTIKTQGNLALSAKTSVFLPASKTAEETKVDPKAEELRKMDQERFKKDEEARIKTETRKKEKASEEQQNKTDQTIHSASGVSQTAPVDIKQSVKQFQPSNTTGNVQQKSKAIDVKDLKNPNENSNNKNELLYVIFGSVIAILLVIFFWFRAKGKMEEIIGDRNDYNFDDEPKPEVKKKKPNISIAVNNLDKKYSKPVKMPVNNISQEEISDVISDDETEQEVHTVVDLDELLSKGQNNKSTVADNIDSIDAKEEDDDEEENLALEEFLSTFNFDEEDEEDNQTLGINEELYNKCLSLENIKFSKNDIDALYKLISVELDNDFLTDFKTNPERAKAMLEEMEKQRTKTHKSSELLTLNVKDMLPDLSKALKKQGHREIEYERKAQTVYFSEGYEVSTLKLNEALPDLSVEINNKKAYQSRPSDSVEYADNNYEVETMSIANELPNLADALKHPDKYNKPVVKKARVNEKELLNNISNVTFKPFDDGSREFEVVNEIDAPSVDDMQKEFSQFNNEFEIVNEEEIMPAQENDNDDFASLYDNNYVDLDVQNDEILEEIVATEEDTNTSLVEDNNELVELTPVEKENSKARKDSATEELLQRIKESEAKKQEEALHVEIAEKQNTKIVKEIVSQTPEFCVLDGEKYSVISSTNFTDKMGCYLAKNNNGYIIIGFVGEKTFNIKQYEKLDMEKLQSRKSEMLDDGTQRYIVRIGIHKFIMNVKSDDMEFVMDLC